MKQKAKFKQFSQTLIKSKIPRKKISMAKNLKGIPQSSGCRKPCEIQKKKKREIQIKTTQRKQ